MTPVITGIIVLLFPAVVGLLGYGAWGFQAPVDVMPSDTAYAGRSINMRLEVLWTAIAAIFLLGIFIAVVWRGAV